MLALLACASASASAVGEAACDAADTSQAWASLAVQPPGCEQHFEEEESMLAHSCWASAMQGTSASDNAAVMQGTVCVCMRKRWWRAAKQLLPRVPATASSTVLRFAQAHRDGASGVVTDLLRGSQTGIRHDKVTSAVPAVQWAQSHATVHLLVRFTVKKHGPVAVANVDDAAVELSASMISFTAKGRGKPLIFELQLPLHAPILPEPDKSSYSFEGRGQLTLTLAKAENISWPQLCPPDDGTTRRGAVSTWHEMQETLDKDETTQAPKPSADNKKEKPPAAATTKKKPKAAKPKPPEAWGAWLLWRWRASPYYPRQLARWLGTAWARLAG